MNILHVIAVFLTVLSLYYAVDNTRYLYTGRGKPRLYPVAFLLIANYILLFNMLWNHSCEAILIDINPIPQVKAYPVVDTTLIILSIIIFGLNLLSVLSAWTRDILSIFFISPRKGERNEAD